MSTAGPWAIWIFPANMDVCIAIRMAVKQGDKVTVQAGAGIVADSVPEREYAESGNRPRRHGGHGPGKRGDLTG